ncbi:hypothetical protein BVRB_1g016970 [Beta vulgaris subsp. vulgaris]|nr:hypothetical protein BVRB_1g016970 [Beta vulgaris subsp. vulgaris]
MAEIKKMPTEEATRESLIALSYSLPDKSPNSPDSSEKMTEVDNGVTDHKKNGNSVDYWSDLISLSYTSPDAVMQPEVIS